VKKAPNHRYAQRQCKIFIKDFNFEYKCAFIIIIIIIIIMLTFIMRLLLQNKNIGAVQKYK